MMGLLKHSPSPKKKGAWDDNIRTVIYAVLIAVAFRSILFEPFHIPSGSMKSNLLVGDYLFVSKYSYGYSRYSFPFGFPLFEGRALEFRKPERGEVAVFRLPKNPRVDYIKRIIGLPGDRIQVKNSIVYINGEPLKREPVDLFTDDEDPLHVRTLQRLHETLPEGKVITVLQERTTGYANNTREYVVPEGHYFLMGDNRDNSRDSRFPGEVGFVPEENLIGPARRIVFSTDGSAAWWQVWKWPGSLRFERMLRTID